MSTIVLVHAFPMDHRLYDDIADLIAGAGWQVLLPDLRGCGGASDFDETPNLQRCADDIVAMLDRLGIERAVVGGTSLGGYVTMAMMRRAPERMAGAILIDTKASADAEEGRANRLRTADQVEKAGTTEALWRAMLPNVVGKTTHDSRPDVVERVRSIMADSRPLGVANLQRAMADRPDSHADIAAFRGPLLSLRGTEDVIASAEDHAKMVAAAQDGTHVDIPGCGHLPPLEAPAACAEAIIDFLALVQRTSC